MLTVGSVGPLYLLAISVTTTMLVDPKSGLLSFVLNVVTVPPGLATSHRASTFGGSVVTTLNYGVINLSQVVALSAVFDALGTALARSNTNRTLLEIAGRTARLGACASSAVSPTSSGPTRSASSSRRRSEHLLGMPKRWHSSLPTSMRSSGRQSHDARRGSRSTSKSRHSPARRSGSGCASWEAR